MRNLVICSVVAGLLAGVCYAQPKGPIKDPPDRSFPDPQPAVSPAGEKFACPMKCEGSKTYGEAGRCPVCGMKLKQVVSKPPAFSVKAEGDLISGNEVLLRVTADKGHALSSEAQAMIFNAKDEYVPAKAETLSNGDRKLRVTFPDGGEFRVVMPAAAGRFEPVETVRFAVARNVQGPPPESVQGKDQGPITVSWRTEGTLRAGTAWPVLIGIAVNKKLMWEKVHEETRMVVFSGDMSRAAVLRPEEEAEKDLMKFEVVVPQKGNYRLFVVHPLAESGVTDGGRREKAD